MTEMFFSFSSVELDLLWCFVSTSRHDPINKVAQRRSLLPLHHSLYVAV